VVWIYYVGIRLIYIFKKSLGHQNNAFVYLFQFRRYSVALKQADEHCLLVFTNKYKIDCRIFFENSVHYTKRPMHSRIFYRWNAPWRCFFSKKFRNNFIFFRETVNDVTRIRIISVVRMSTNPGSRLQSPGTCQPCDRRIRTTAVGLSMRWQPPQHSIAYTELSLTVADIKKHFLHYRAKG